MQDDVELIAFAKEFGCDAILEALLRIRFSLRNRFCQLGAKRRRRTRFSPTITVKIEIGFTPKHSMILC
jgi:hypothetical protein